MDCFILFSIYNKKIWVNTWQKGSKKGQVMRNLCKKCRERPVAINYRKENKIFYRSICDHCARNKKDGRPLWAKAGYKKKSTCDKCGHTSKYDEQFNVYHIDGDLTNCRFSNLKTICANCQRILHKEGVRWRQGDLTPDL